MRRGERNKPYAAQQEGVDYVLRVAAAEIGFRIHIQKHCRGPFLISTESEEVSLYISAAVGIREYRACDTVERLFQRADQQLYGQKGRAMAAR